MSAQVIQDLQARLEGYVFELQSIGFPSTVRLGTDAEILKSNAEQAIVANRIQKLNILIGVMQSEIRALKAESAAVFPDDAALLNIICQLSGSGSEATKTTQARTSMRAFRKALAEAKAGEL